MGTGEIKIEGRQRLFMFYREITEEEMLEKLEVVKRGSENEKDDRRGKETTTPYTLSIMYLDLYWSTIIILLNNCSQLFFGSMLTYK